MFHSGKEIEYCFENSLMIPLLDVYTKNLFGRYHNKEFDLVRIELPLKFESLKSTDPVFPELNHFVQKHPITGEKQLDVFATVLKIEREGREYLVPHRSLIDYNMYIGFPKIQVNGEVFYDKEVSIGVDTPNEKVREMFISECEELIEHWQPFEFENLQV